MVTKDAGLQQGADGIVVAEAALIHDRYEVLRVLGRGASATTYLARDNVSGRHLALKALHTRSLAEWKQFELFEREARVLGGLRHHGVPELFEFFELDGGGGKGLELYLAMEWIDGVSLQARLSNGPRLDHTEVMQLASDVLDVLIYLHGRSPPVYHRDIKPSNIVIRQDGTPVLIDFGGVCDGWRKPSDSNDTIVGTTGYMPPEQYMGQVGPWSDLYALGATLLHVLTGRPPAEHDFGSGRHALPADIDVPARLRRFVDAVLAPAPRDRPQTPLEARRILMSDAGAPDATLPAASALGGGSEAQATASRAPERRLYDPGPAPRDPAGPHAVLYTKMRGKFSYPWGCLLHLVALAATLIAGGATEQPAVVVAMIAVWWGAARVKHTLEEAVDAKLPADGLPGARLFIHGRYAIAEVTERKQVESGFKLAYRFDADGKQVTGELATAMLQGIANPPGTRFGVLWLEGDPDKHHKFEGDLASGE